MVRSSPIVDFVLLDSLCKVPRNRQGAKGKFILVRRFAVSWILLVWVRFDTNPEPFASGISIKSMPNPVGRLRKNLSSAQALVQEEDEKDPRIPDCPRSVKRVDLGSWVKQAVQVFNNFGREGAQSRWAGLFGGVKRLIVELKLCDVQPQLIELVAGAWDVQSEVRNFGNELSDRTPFVLACRRDRS